MGNIPKFWMKKLETKPKCRFKILQSKESISWTGALSLFAIITVILVGFLLLLFVTFREQLKVADDYLKTYSNIMPFISLVMAALALSVAFCAFRYSIVRPRLKLTVEPLEQTSTDVNLIVDELSRVLNMKQLSQWSIRLANIGEASARYPMVRMIFNFEHFDGPFFRDNEFPGWTAVLHAYGRGYYGFQWSPDSSAIIYSGFSINLPTINFSGKHLERDFEIAFVYVADGARSTTCEFPVKLIRPPQYNK